MPNEDHLSFAARYAMTTVRHGTDDNLSTITDAE